MIPMYPEEYEKKNGKPDGFVIIHHRVGGSLCFGPFANIAETEAWLKENPSVKPNIIPTHKDVNWSR